MAKSNYTEPPPCVFSHSSLLKVGSGGAERERRGGGGEFRYPQLHFMGRTNVTEVSLLRRHRRSSFIASSLARLLDFPLL